MEKKIYNFQNPEVQEKATLKARTSKRPSTYYSKAKRLQEARKELIKQELLKDGFIQQVGADFTKINKALIASASNPKSGSGDRKLIYQILGLLNNKEDRENQPSIGQVLAELAKR